ncbi:MAG TPA: alpha/beta fold hydrolase [Roseovarius sp.]
MSESDKKKKGRTNKAGPAPEARAKSGTPSDAQRALVPSQDTTASDSGLHYTQRFDAPEWQQWPFNLIYRNFLMTQHWWLNAAKDIEGMSRREEQVMFTAMRQVFDMMAPSNLPWTNPEVIATTTQEGGANLIRGAHNLAEDWKRALSGRPPVGAEDFVAGRDVAVTPGKVVFRSYLLELIQYAPQTETVVSEPLLIVPAWIMKYYILDLSPHNSMVNYLVGQGFTVFMISWRNPDAADRDLGMKDYIDAVGMALDAVGRIVPETRIHAIGYCLGGTLLSVKAAQMARDHDDRLKTMTLFAARTDFDDPAELELFVSEHSVSVLERSMSDKGYLDTRQTVDALKVLRSNDFIWPFYISDYLLGSRQPLSDILAWSADTTRMPYRMYSEYLRRIVVADDLAKGRYEVDGKPVAIGDISVPVFVVGTLDDDVAPWKSVYKLHHLAKTDLTFLLTSGGHVDGIVVGPDAEGPTYQIAMTSVAVPRIAPEEWQSRAPVKTGSWWPELATWLRGHSGAPASPPRMGGASGQEITLEDAPGSYVLQR